MPRRARDTGGVSFSARRAAALHAPHAQIARRVNLSQYFSISETIETVV
jgi:hypothetical protein